MTNITNLNADDRQRSEADDWKAMPFVEVDDGGNMNCWAPARVEAADHVKVHGAECSLGMIYAFQLIDHQREYKDFDTSNYFPDIVQAVVKRGRWGSVEIGFFNEIGRYISGGTSLITLHGNVAVS